MNKPILQIIDDESDRKELYRQLFEDSYQLRFTESLQDFSSQYYEDVYCFVIDMDLSNWQVGDTKNVLLFDILEAIGEHRPIILVSSKWDEVIDILNKKQLRKNNILGTIGLKDIFIETMSGKVFNKDAPLASTIFFIKQKLYDFYKYTQDIKELNSEINILHISDLQFGDPNWDKNSVLSEYLIPKYLRKNTINIDFIVISGDFTYSAVPNQFNDCLEWLKKFCKEIFDFEGYQDRLLLVPGNHDINLSINSLSRFEYNFGSKEKNYLKIREEEINDFSNFSFFPFKEFATKLTKSNNWFSDNLSFINDRFAHWGLRFVHLNTDETISAESPNKFGINNESVELLASSNDSRTQQELFTIFLSHHGPDDLGYKTGEESSESWIFIRNLIETIGGNLFLHGHRHSVISGYKIPEVGDIISNVEFFMSGTLNLKNVGTEGGRRGFSIISLNRNDGKVVKYGQRKFEIHQGKITSID